MQRVAYYGALHTFIAKRKNENDVQNPGTESVIYFEVSAV